MKLAIVSLVHQNRKTVEFMIQNLQLFVKGDFIWILHYNGSDPLGPLPSWVRRARTEDTAPHTRRLADAIIRGLEMALDCDLVMLLSSGTVFVREWVVPSTPIVALTTHCVFNPRGKNDMLAVQRPIPREYPCAYIQQLMDVGELAKQWHYPRIEQDLYFKSAMVKRGYTHYRAAQMTGQVWPVEVARRIVADAPIWTKAPNGNYPCEEVYFSTYAAAYAHEMHLPVLPSIVTIDWSVHYEVTTVAERVVAHCKVADDSPIRRDPKYCLTPELF